MATNPEDKGSLEELKKNIESLGSPIDKILESIGEMYDEADKLNNAFLGGRVRMDEMADAASRAASGVLRLGGDITDVSNTMAKIAEGSRRNVIATEDQVSKLYAASKILGDDVGSIVNSFEEVGVGTAQIGENLEKSIEYVQSVGLNANVVMGDVKNNMELMNKFNFQDGVVGMSRMAAQASMLRFDMNATSNFAEKVMKPEGAIETASALQRLGVAVGQLGDPFSLMNDAINDPGALQDSLIKATKQFTQFDEKTKTFKINPQGLLTLREMATETGISYEQLSKSALAAADLDKRLSAISPTLDFENEEDKQFIANMATMSKEGDYVVKLKNDETGIIETKKLGELTQGEITKLREQQENAPKTLEEIQISQLDVLKDMSASLKANLAKGTFGVAGASVVRGNITGAERITRALTSSIDKNVPESGKITEKINETIDKMSSLFIQRDSNKISTEEFAKQLKTLEDSVISEANSLGVNGAKAIKDIFQQTNQKVTGNSGIEQEFRRFAQETLGITGKVSESKEAKGKKEEPRVLSSAELLGRTTDINRNVTKQSTTSNQTTTNKVEFGNFKITIDTPPGTTLTQQQLNSIFNSEQFKQYIAKLTDPKTAGKNQGVVSYG
jgi:hypothetical protein